MAFRISSKSSKNRLQWWSPTVVLGLLIPCGVAVLCVFTSTTGEQGFTPETPSKESHASARVTSERRPAEPVGSSTTSLPDPEFFQQLDLVSETEPALVPEKKPDPIPLPEREIDTLHQRTADWRYLGCARTQSKTIALIQRMESPDTVWKLSTGQKLEGVIIESATPMGLLVRLDRFTRTLPLSPGPAFDLDNLDISEADLEDPQAFFSTIYSQTLGKYITSAPEGMDEETFSSEGEEELMLLLAEKYGWQAPVPGESLESWLDGLGDESPASRP